MQMNAVLSTAACRALAADDVRDICLTGQKTGVPGHDSGRLCVRASAYRAEETVTLLLSERRGALRLPFDAA